MDKLRIGIVGAGNNTRKRHILGLQAVQDVEITAVANRTLASAQNVAEQFGIAKAYEHWWELVASDEIDAVVIGTWPDMHARVSIAALESGKHVLCEARLARTFAEAKAMLMTAQRHPQLVAQVVPSPFTLPVDTTIKRLIAEGFIGQVVALEVTEKGFSDPNAPLTWRQDQDISGVNVMSLGIWYEAVMRWLGEASRVMAMGQTFVKMRPDDTGVLRAVAVPDHLEVIAEMVCGAQLHIGLSQVSGLAPVSGPSIAIFGSEGSLQFRNGQLYGARKNDTELKAVEVPEHEAGGWRVEEEFVGAIRGSESVSHTAFADGLKYMAFTEAVHQSMSENRGVYLSELV